MWPFFYGMLVGFGCYFCRASGEARAKNANTESLCLYVLGVGLIAVGAYFGFKIS